jgi:hypothetical protein
MARRSASTNVDPSIPAIFGHVRCILSYYSFVPELSFDAREMGSLLLPELSFDAGERQLLFVLPLLLVALFLPELSFDARER